MLENVGKIVPGNARLSKIVALSCVFVLAGWALVGERAMLGEISLSMNQTSYLKAQVTADFGDGNSDWNRIPTEESRYHYEEFRNKVATIRNQTTGEITAQKQLAFRSVSGLGHRLTRMANMFHTARIQQLPHINQSWGWECGKNEEGHPDIFDNLFGFGPMVTYPEANVKSTGVGGVEITQPSEYEGMWRLETEKDQRVINDTPTYMIHSICRRGISNGSLRTDQKLIFEKAVSDEQCFRQLRTLFRYNGMVRDFVEEYSFSERIVLGIHVRTGNGETGDFVKKFRGFHDIDTWIEKTALALSQLASKMNDQRPFVSLKPLLFVATDKTSVVDKLANATEPYGFTTVSFPQKRPEKGVSYANAGKNESCHNSWIAQVVDAILLGTADAVIAGRYSSFTQAIPLYAVLGDTITMERPHGFDPGNRSSYGSPRSKTDEEFYSHRLFCESNAWGDKIKCYDDYFEWMGDIKSINIMGRVGKKTIITTYRHEVMIPCVDTSELK